MPLSKLAMLNTSLKTTANRRSLLWSIALGFTLALAIAFALQSLGLSENGDPDEGVHLLVARLLNHGYPFHTFFYDQFALFPFMLAATQRLGGETLLSARLTVLLFAAFGLAGIAALGKFYAGRLVAVLAIALAILHPYYLYVSRVTIAEAPSLGLLMWSLVSMIVFAQSQRQRWLILSTVLFCASVLLKPLLIGFALTLAFWFIMAHLRRAGGHVRVMWRVLLVNLGIVCLAGLMTAAPFVDLLHLNHEFDRTVGFHMLQSPSYASSFAAQLQGLQDWLFASSPWLLLALLGICVSLKRLVWSGPLILGTFATLVLLVILPPFPHHYAVLVPPLAVFTAMGVNAGIKGVHFFVALLRQRSLRAGIRRRAVWAHGAAVMMFCLALPIVFLNAPRVLALNAHVFDDRWLDRSPAIRLLKKSTPANSFVMGDDPKLIYLAKRLVPPSAILFLYNTTFDFLPEAEARFARSTREYPVTAITMTGPYLRHTELVQWIKTNYPVRAAVGDGIKIVRARIYRLPK